MYITYITMDSTAEFDLFALGNPVPLRDEAFVFFTSAAVFSQGKRSPSPRYQNAFLKCKVAASLPYGIKILKNDR